MTKIISDPKISPPPEAPQEQKAQVVREQPAAQQIEGALHSGNAELGTQDYGATSQRVNHSTPLPAVNPIGIRAGSKVQAWIQRLGKEAVEGSAPGTHPVHFEPGFSPFMGLAGDQVPGWGGDQVSATVSADEIPRQLNLTAEEKAWENEFVDLFCQDPRGMVKDFKGLVGDTHIFEVDLAKRCFPGYGRTMKPTNDGERRIRAEANVPLHQVATAITKLAFLERLDELAELPDDHADKLVLVTTGGCAAGKGSLVDLLKVQQPDLGFGAVWDAAGENNALENPWILDECASRGISVIFGYVHAEPEDKIRSVLERAVVQGRMVDVIPFTYSYLDGAKNMTEFLASPEYKEAERKGLASAFGLAPGDFNTAAIDDPEANPYPDARPLPSTPEGGIEIPQQNEPKRVLDRVLAYVDQYSSILPISDALMRSALSGLARRWPEQRHLLEGTRHV